MLLCFCTLAADLIFKVVFFQLLSAVHGVRVGACCCTLLGTLAANLSLRLVSIWLQLLSRSFFEYISWIQLANYVLKTFHTDL